MSQRAFYKIFSLPVVKGFLVALLTYQITYFAWLSLEGAETKREKREELNSLQGQLKQLLEAKKGN